MPRIDYFHEHFLDRRKCMNCGNYRNWQEMPVCPCGWPRFKNFDITVLGGTDEQMAEEDAIL